MAEFNAEQFLHGKMSATDFELRKIELVQVAK